MEVDICAALLVIMGGFALTWCCCVSGVFREDSHVCFFFETRISPSFFFFLRFILHPGVRRLFLFNIRIVLVYTFLFVMTRIPCERFQLSNSG